MANDVRLIRESSETPTITNIDDARMIRYAYGGDGVVASFGEELKATVANGIFRIGKGLIVIQGWEVEISDSGWGMKVAAITGTQYYLIYAEVSIAIESAQIKSVFNTGSVPKLDAGDDLTASPNGTARYPLYSFKVVNGDISDVTALYKTLTYATNEITEIKSRLEKLKYREDEFNVILDGEVIDGLNYLKRQGNFVIGRLSFRATSRFPTDENDVITIGSFPENFSPKEETGMIGTVTLEVGGEILVGLGNFYVENGNLKIFMPGCYRVDIVFGYEAEPL